MRGTILRALTRWLPLLTAVELIACNAECRRGSERTCDCSGAPIGAQLCIVDSDGSNEHWSLTCSCPQQCTTPGARRDCVPGSRPNLDALCTAATRAPYCGQFCEPVAVGSRYFAWGLCYQNR
jgi:hypothetical protein